MSNHQATSQLHEYRLCPVCSRYDLRGTKVPRHNDPKTDKPCPGAGQEFKPYTMPSAPPENCLKCGHKIEPRTKCLIVKTCSQGYMDFGRGGNTFIMNPVEKIVGGIHLECEPKFELIAKGANA